MTTKKRVSSAVRPTVMLHVFPSFGYGGQQARFAALVKGLGPSFRHHVVSLDGDLSAQALLPPAAVVDVQSMRFGKSALAGVINYWKFRSRFGKIKPDILCTYNWGSIEAALANVIGRQRPHIHFEDGFGPDESIDRQHFRRVKARRMLLGAAHFVVPSHGLEEVAAEKWDVARERLHRISNGVDFARFQTQQAALRPAVTVGTVGALRSEKNYRRLISAFPKADRSGKAHLKIIGDGQMRKSLADAAKSSKARARISLPGSTSAPETAYREFDVFALSSDTEQAPLTVMEAMAAGLPVVATNVGEIANMVAPENLAFITSLGDEGAYVDALAHLLQNPDARAQLGAANRKKAKAEFDLKPMVEKHRALYLSLTEKAKT